MKKAKRPLNRQAVGDANDQFYANHPEMVDNGSRVLIDPNDPTHRSYQKEWIALYEKNGGRAEDNSSKAKKPKEPVQPCPLKCSIIDIKVTCQHGEREAKYGNLEVVPSESGDTISLTAKSKNPCFDHPLWKVSGYTTRSFTGNTASFNAQAWRFGKPTWLTYVAPHKYTITSCSCSGQEKITLKAYPSDKLSLKLDAKMWRSAKDKVDYAIEKVLGMYLKNPKFDVFSGGLKIEAGWEEYSRDYRAFYKYGASVGFNPLIGGKFRIPFGPTAAMPNWMKEYGDLYLFAEFSGGVDVNGHWSRETPDNVNMFVDVKGSVNGKIGASLLLMDPKVILAEIDGGTGVSVTGKAAENKDDPAVEFQAMWEGIKGEATIEMVWGIVEFKREFKIVDPKPLTREPWVFKLSSAINDQKGA